MATSTSKVFNQVKPVFAIEFQLIQDIKHGVIGRLFIPGALRGTGKVSGKLVYDSDSRKGFTCNHKGSRTIEFIGSVAEYQRCMKEYALSNMAVNQNRTHQLMRRMTAEIKAQATPVATPVINPPIPAIVTEAEVKQAVKEMTMQWDKEAELVAQAEEQRDIVANLKPLKIVNPQGNKPKSKSMPKKIIQPQEKPMDTDTQILNIQATISEMSSDGDLGQEELEDLFDQLKGCDPSITEDIDFPVGDSKVYEVTLADYTAMTVKELRSLAKTRNIKGVSKLKKQQLAELLFSSVS